MIKEIITDKLLLSMPSDPVGEEEDVDQLVLDMLDTAAHWAGTRTGCVGLAANQVGRLRRIILVWTGASFEIMINPEWQRRDGKMGLSHEQCLSRPSVNVKVKRHKRIECTWYDRELNLYHRKFSNFEARIIQHEIDHLNGIFINN